MSFGSTMQFLRTGTSAGCGPTAIAGRTAKPAVAGSHQQPVPGDAGDVALYRGRADGIEGVYRPEQFPEGGVQRKIYDQGFREGYGIDEGIAGGWKDWVCRWACAQKHGAEKISCQRECRTGSPWVTSSSSPAPTRRPAATGFAGDVACGPHRRYPPGRPRAPWGDTYWGGGRKPNSAIAGISAVDAIKLGKYRTVAVAGGACGQPPSMAGRRSIAGKEVCQLRGDKIVCVPEHQPRPPSPPPPPILRRFGVQPSPSPSRRVQFVLAGRRRVKSPSMAGAVIRTRRGTVVRTGKGVAGMMVSSRVGSIPQTRNG